MFLKKLIIFRLNSQAFHLTKQSPEWLNYLEFLNNPKLQESENLNPKIFHKLLSSSKNTCKKCIILNSNIYLGLNSKFILDLLKKKLSTGFFPEKMLYTVTLLKMTRKSLISSLSIAYLHQC